MRLLVVTLRVLAHKGNAMTFTYLQVFGTLRQWNYLYLTSSFLHTNAMQLFLLTFRFLAHKCNTINCTYLQVFDRPRKCDNLYLRSGFWHTKAMRLLLKKALSVQEMSSQPAVSDSLMTLVAEFLTIIAQFSFLPPVLIYCILFSVEPYI